MEFVKVLALRGPNIWAYFPVMEVWVDLGALKDSPSDSIPGFNERLMSWLPGMIEHRCSIGERGGFFERLRTGTYPAHILEHVSLELQSLAGCPAGFGRARESSTEGIFKVVFKYKEEHLARACLHAARRLMLAAIRDQPFDVAATVSDLRAIAARYMLNPGIDAIVQAGRARNIPFHRLDDGNLVQLGYGARQRRISLGETGATSSIARGVALDKQLTRQLLHANGIPTGTGYEVDSAEDAWETVDEWMSPPAVFKPRHGSGGQGVTTNVITREEVLAAYQSAAQFDSSVLIEKQIPGATFRLLVVGGKLAAAARLDPAPVDVTGLVHPETATHAINAAHAVGLDIAGVDVIAADIAMPLTQQGGVVLEVNASPDLCLHLSPSQGEPRNVGAAVIDMLFPAGDTGRIPIAAITGTNGKTTVTRFLAHILNGTGKCVGMTCTDGIYINGERVATGDCSGPASARSLLLNPRIEIGVFETARGGILRAGVAFNECEVAVVTNIGEGDHLGISDMNTPEDLARVKRGIVELVSKQGSAVLNAADSLVAGMARFSPGRVMFFATDAANPVLAGHRASGGRAVFVRDGTVIMAEGENEDPIITLDQVPVTHNGQIAFEVENTLAVLGAAWAMGVPREVILNGVRSFYSDMEKVPGRFNLLDVRGATVIVDYGHNVHALRAMVDALNKFPHARRAAVFSSSGDRRDSDIVQMGQLLGGAFDRVILYEDNDRFERPPGEITALLRQGMSSGDRVSEIESIEGGLNALHHALDTIQPGELLVAQAHLADPTIAFLREYLAAQAGGA